MDEICRVELFGALRVARGDEVISAFPTRKAAALLAYLAYHVGREQPREVLAEMLWPGVDERSGRNSLSVALSAIRKVIEPPGIPPGAALIADRFTARLDARAVGTDVREFESLLNAAARASAADEEAALLERGASLYTGPLLAGHSEDWIPPERERLADCFFEAASRLAGLAEEAGDLPRAISAARRAVGVDPLREDAVRTLMRLYAAAGQAAGALRQYQRLQQLLSAQLGGAPSTATQALVRQIRETAQQAQVPAGEADDASMPGEYRIKTPVTATDAETPADGGRQRLALPPPHLPAFLTRFIGRREERQRLRQLLEAAAGGTLDPASYRPRLITLTGPGGSGKTRLAAQAGADVIDAYGGAVWFIALADLNDAALLPGRILTTLRLSPPEAIDPRDYIAQALAGRPALLVLDNLEHLLGEGKDDAAFLLRRLLERLPDLTCLVTSRQRLKISGEQEFPVAPLPVPRGRHWGKHDGLGPRVPSGHGHPTTDDRGITTDDGLLAEDASVDNPSAVVHRGVPKPRGHPRAQSVVEELLAYPGVELFADRAQAARPDFALTTENASAVATLCTELEGIPLALELAAARVQVLTPAQMLAQLDARFQLLVSEHADQQPRHRTLYSALEWSFRLLPPSLQRFFARLSVFRDGWTLEAAAAIAYPPTPHPRRSATPPLHKMERGPGGEVFPLSAILDALSHLRSSSLVLTEERNGAVRFRMLETLREFGWEQLSPEERDEVRRRHRDWYLQFAIELQSHPHGGDEGGRLDRLEGEQSNLWAALEWCEQDPEGLEHGLRLASTLGSYWTTRGYVRQGREYLDRMLARADGLAQTDDPQVLRARGWALASAGTLACHQGEFIAARPLFEEVRSVAERLANDAMLSTSLNLLASVAQQLGDYRAARQLFEESLALKRKSGDPFGLAHSLVNIGAIARLQGDYDTSRALAEEGLSVSRSLRDTRCTSLSLDHLGLTAADTGDDESAHFYFDQALALRHELGDRSGIAGSLLSLGTIERRQGRLDLARRMIDESLAARQELGDRRGIAACLYGLGLVARDAGDHVQAGALLRQSLRLRHDLADRRGITECLEQLAQVAGTREPAGAARLAGAARALREQLGLTLPVPERAEHAALLEALRAELGEPAAAAALAAGAALALDQVVTAALSESYAVPPQI